MILECPMASSRHNIQLIPEGHPVRRSGISTDVRWISALSVLDKLRMSVGPTCAMWDRMLEHATILGAVERKKELFTTRVGILSWSNVVADTESAIGSGSESHISPSHFQLEPPNLVHFCYANITHKWTRFGDSSWKIENPSDFENRFRKLIATQTTDIFENEIMHDIDNPDDTFDSDALPFDTNFPTQEIDQRKLSPENVAVSSHKNTEISCHPLKYAPMLQVSVISLQFPMTTPHATLTRLKIYQQSPRTICQQKSRNTKMLPNDARKEIEENQFALLMEWSNDFISYAEIP
ncbi:hypothetical protein OUZ56_012406 [Daphnia magna]|uniref:Uncharacterized protein n=1 Tax=Daphnia magna TaxID=35525 RepID=A0ABQ9Z2X8_9CRUS|nr:hypothetical protein OUZ56_012406 [Daphnia magna]